MKRSQGWKPEHRKRLFLKDRLSTSIQGETLQLREIAFGQNCGYVDKAIVSLSLAIRAINDWYFLGGHSVVI